MTKRRVKERKRIASIGADLFTAIVKADLGAECVKEFRFHPQRRWRFDYALPLYKIALEVEGGVWTQGRHTRPKGFLGDVEKYNAGALLGWRIFRTTPNELFKRSTIEMIREAINAPFGTQ